MVARFSSTPYGGIHCLLTPSIPPTCQGVNRDTRWLAMIDGDWEAKKSAIEARIASYSPVTAPESAC